MMNNQPNYERILVATDFSRSAEAALKQAVWLARNSSAQIEIVNTIPDLSMSLYWGPLERSKNQQELRDRSETKMRRMIVDLGAMDLNVKFHTLIGEPFVEITRAALAESYDLVLAGTRSMDRLEQFFIGSTAKRLIRKCPSSVWIVKAGHVVPPRVVLAATDFSDIGSKAVKEGMLIAEQFSAEFHLLHIVDSKDVPEDVISRVPKGSSLRQEINEEASRRMEKSLDSLGVDRKKIQVHLSWGTPWQEIQRISRHQAADMIVIGTVGRNGIKGLLLGNTAEKVLDTCDCSIFTVKPDGFISPIEPASTALHAGPESHGS